MNDKGTSDFIEGKSILLIGGSGSLGQCLISRLLPLRPKVLRVLANDEASLVETQEQFKSNNLRFLMGDVRDKDRMRRSMRGIDIVIHAAALKHVSICEYDPDEAIKTNIMGAINIGESAITMRVKRVIVISSDKAVNPVNLYGATKLCAEKYFLSLHNNTPTRFSCVRFGNFWGSRGSVVEKWQKQKMEGAAITITDQNMSRYFINIDEAADFTIRCICKMNGGEIFIPIMANRTLHDLVQQVAPDCPVQTIGRRRGEKKSEELYNEDEEKRLIREEDCLTIRYS